MPRRVVITGLGTVSAAGIGIEPSWRRLREAPPDPVQYQGPPPTDGVRFPAFRAPDYDLAALGVPRRALSWLAGERLSAARDVHHLLAATSLALTDAGLDADVDRIDPHAAVVVGDESPGFEQVSHALFRLGHDGPVPDDPAERYRVLVDDFLQLNTFFLPFYLARAFHFRGLGLFVNSACTSGLNALEIAAQEVRSGRSRMAVAVGGDNPLSVAKYLWFRDLGLYAQDGKVRPFDSAQTGFVFGDGASALVLEDAEHARARGVRIWAEYVGASFTQDGWKLTVPSPILEGAALAVERLLADAGVAAGEVDLVVPHGVGAPASDQYEAAMLHRVFGGQPRWPALAAFKPFVGHNLGGCALLETALTVRSMAAGEIPPARNCERPYTRNPLPMARNWLSLPVQSAVKLTCGFAGFYGAVLLRRYEPEETGG